MFKLVLLCLIFSSSAFAVDMKISSLPSLPQSSWASDDMFVVVDQSASTTKKTTVADFNTQYVLQASFPSGILGEENGGTGASQAFGALSVDSTTIGNVSGTDGNLANYSMPANTLTTDGNAVVFTAAGKFAADSNNKRIKVKFGSVDVLDTSAMSFAVGGAWKAEGSCIRLASASQRCEASLLTSISSYPAFVSYATATEDLSGTVNLKITSASTLGTSIETKEIFKVHFRP